MSEAALRRWYWAGVIVAALALWAPWLLVRTYPELSCPPTCYGAPCGARAFAALSVRTPARWALGPCNVAMTDLHSLQTMSAASWSFLSFAFITSNIIGCVLLQVGHPTRGNRASTSVF